MGYEITSCASCPNQVRGADLERRLALRVDDFGTALPRGRFSFGVGNPDTTLLSRSTVDDGRLDTRELAKP